MQYIKIHKYIIRNMYTNDAAAQEVSINTQKL